ncbi:superoxide dismutase family protein [Deinococcus roseus]|uniref:Superoxide dismutase copper/zinc binding domain-containing protein n=1 Tax=Deinococcus roseus TaxID=392414 RepID=A0ABQ2D3N7_9DEIO|nr:superoxide dismutase family protein [Deinococcus roseus]GGJ36441.1 hypothetical protein GCM10008938_23160 [Deinococcus roseus]
MKRLMFSVLPLMVGLALGQAVPASIPLTATATLMMPDGEAAGTATFTQAGNGVQVTVQVSGLAAGNHGMHVHEYGRCTPGVDAATNTIVPFGGAGGHFDPGMTGNHDSPQTDNMHGHGGDLPMLVVGADGTGRATFTTDKISLTGENGILKRSLVVHAMPDDYMSDPSGKSGARERCGVIERDSFETRNYPLPGPQDFPEGVAYDAVKDVLYTGSAANGTIYQIDAKTGNVIKFSDGGAQGRNSALGMKVDASGRLWVAGGASGSISILNGDGTPFKTLMTPRTPLPFINDLVLLPDGSAIVTDSSRPTLFQVTPELRVRKWLDLRDTPIEYQPGTNLNGIVALPDGSALLTIQSNTGILWHIDVASQQVTRVMDGLNNGDGLVLTGQTLYVVRNKDGVVSKVMLAADFKSGTLQINEPLRGLRFPATAVLVGDDLVVTQAQLDKRQKGAPETPFQLTRVKRF